MGTKKKVEKKSRVSPEIPSQNVRFVTYEDLNDGDAFLMKGKLWMKFDVDDQEAVCLNEGGEHDCCLCDEIVEPVDITITWKRRN